MLYVLVCTYNIVYGTILQYYHSLNPPTPLPLRSVRIMPPLPTLTFCMILNPQQYCIVHDLTPSPLKSHMSMCSPVPFNIKKYRVLTKLYLVLSLAQLSPSLFPLVSKFFGAATMGGCGRVVNNSILSQIFGTPIMGEGGSKMCKHFSCDFLAISGNLEHFSVSPM